MSMFLFLLGTLICAAGLALAVPGITFHGGAFQAEVTTPSAVAIVGGLLLIGLALVVRELHRIERAVRARPVGHAVQPLDAAAAAVPADESLPHAPKIEPRAPVMPPIVPPPPTEDPRLREKFPSLLKLENPPEVEAPDASLLPRAAVRVEPDLGVPPSRNGAAGGRIGSAPPGANGARVQLNPRALANGQPRAAGLAPPPPAPPRSAAQQPRRNIQAVPVAGHAAVEGTQAIDTAPPLRAVAGERRTVPVQPAPPPPAVPISVLKSGTIEGMGYTLYSDGSIEAQLPEGTLRFGSITELRNHIEGEF